MSNLLKDKFETKPNSNNGSSRTLMSSDEMRKFIERTNWLEQEGGKTIENALNKVLNPFKSSINKSIQEIQGIRDFIINAIKDEVATIIEETVREAIKKHTKSLNWELRLWRVLFFLLAISGVPYLSCVGFIRLKEIHGDIINNFLMWATLVFIIIIFTYWIANSRGRNGKY